MGAIKSQGTLYSGCLFDIEEILMGKPSFPRYETVSRLMGAIPVRSPLKKGIILCKAY